MRSRCSREAEVGILDKSNMRPFFYFFIFLGGWCIGVGRDLFGGWW